jgi:hypothetical protein
LSWQTGGLGNLAVRGDTSERNPTYGCIDPLMPRHRRS